MKAGDGQALVLAGPLRAGKTVLLRQLVAALIEKGADPKSVFYCSLTAPSTTTAELGKLVELFTTPHGHGPESDLIFLFDPDNLLASSAELEINTDSFSALRGTLFGDIYDQSEHGYGVEIKAVSYHLLELISGPPSKIKEILDL